MGNSPKILIIDDIPSFCRETQQTLKNSNLDAHYCISPVQALQKLQKQTFDLVITTLVMNEMSGFDVIRGIRGIRGQNKKVPIILVTGYGTEQSATEAIRLGANDYINKPVSGIELVARVLNRLNTSTSSQQGGSGFQFEHLHSNDPQMRDIFETLRKVAVTESRVLIEGETGTGKQLVARAIHTQSNRRNGPIVELNCAAVPVELLESELFGHEKGAFTGATARWCGRFEEAVNGTLFLDEIGEMSYVVQSKLLQVLQDGTYVRIGGKGAQTSDARIVAATNRQLQEEVDDGRFRADLFYRLNVIRITIPPLRQRKSDISLLANLFLERFSAPRSPLKRFSSAAMSALEQYRWPGNVRELENLVERYAILHPTEEIDIDDLPPRILSSGKAENESRSSHSWNFKQAKADFEQNWLRTVIAASNGNLSQAARLANMDRAQFFRLAKRHKFTNSASKI